MRREPDARYYATLKAQIEPDHPIEAQLWRCIRQLETSAHIARAVEIYGDLFERERLQPWIIAGATDMDIADRTGVHPVMLEVYRHLFFDITAFRDVFEKQRWVAMYDQRGSSTAEGALYLKKAVLHGVEAVAHVMGVQSKLSPDFVLEQSMRDTFFRGLALRDAKLTSREIEAAHGLIKTATALATEAAKTAPPGVNDILIRIKHRDMTQTSDAVAETGEIFH